jgi:hypothetical protein
MPRLSAAQVVLFGMGSTDDHDPRVVELTDVLEVRRCHVGWREEALTVPVRRPGGHEILLTIARSSLAS